MLVLQFLKYNILNFDNKFDRRIKVNKWPNIKGENFENKTIKGKFDFGYNIKGQGDYLLGVLIT